MTVASIRPLRVRALTSSIWPSAHAAGRVWPGPRTPTQVRRKSGPYGYTQAKSLVFSEHGEPKDVLKLHTHSISPELPSESVFLRTLAAPINPADVNLIQGTYGVKPTFSSLIGTASPSAIPGNEGVFEVVATSVPDRFARGDWVIPARTGFGTWRTHAVASADDVMPIRKDGLTLLQAATVSVNPCSAYRMLRDFVTDPPLREGDWFAQNGANSGVGRAAIQLGALWGYRSVNVIRARASPAATKALKDELTALGATLVVTEEEFEARTFRKELAGRTRGSREAVRLGLNCVGGPSARTLARSLGTGATLVTYGGMSREPLTLPVGSLIFHDLRVVGFWLSRWADRDPAARRRTVDEILDLARAGRFHFAPAEKIPWSWDTALESLTAAVQGTLEGYRAGKGLFIFGDT
ncbi:NAD(P)-binding protein [Durotheca rogersii]|uniref:NAD(P)-binding protein n=1 Tax=Durotheca rogersii TaxID=419775 RepID=UPI00222064D7|nr:NAD(P)-binding protein [Durotheca rogersii]KAI5861080.1 NAD(P)-binding protein [Durotheca rogersii]